MNERRPEKAALYAVLINSTSTCLKFLMAWLTGSLAVAADAYHSFSDIITSVLVFLAIRIDRLSAGESASDDGQERLPRYLAFFRDKLENLISLFISLLLLAIAVEVLWQAAQGGSEIIERSILAACIMLVAALASYFLSQFQIAVGKASSSVALVADGHHARVDMLTTLLVSLSLFAHAAGFNIDVLAAAVIGFLILLQALETLVNVIRQAISGDEEQDKPLFYVHQQQLVADLIFDASVGDRVVSSMERFLGYSFSDTKVYRLLRYKLPSLLLIIVLLYWGTTAISFIELHEQGLMFRFGKLVQEEPLEPGHHLKYPWPIDILYLHPVKRLRRVTVGFKGETKSERILWTKQHHEVEYEMLTGDAQFITVFMTVEYHVRDIKKYHLSTANPELVLEGIANSELLEVLAALNFFEIAIHDRRERELLIERVIQRRCDDLDLGLVIDTVTFKDIHPPVSVAPQFEAVISAEEERETKINEREAVRNRLIPMARAQAERIVAEAEAYEYSTLGEAKGKAKRFELRRNLSSSVRQVQKLLLKREAQLEGMQTPAKVLLGRGAKAPSIVIVPAGGNELNDLSSAYGH